MLRTETCLTLLLWLVASAGATVVHVPGDYESIQEGVDAAVDGDTVLVADGTYSGVGNYNIDFGGRAIVVMSENGPAFTIIDCGGGGRLDPQRGFHFHSGEGSFSVVWGFTIRNGYAYGSWPQSCGGGIYCEGSSPTIIGNVITENVAVSAGGGIGCRDSAPVIVDNTIVGNSTSWDGGGVYCDASSPLLAGNTIADNAADKGGAVFGSQSSSPTVVSSILWANEAAMGQEIYLTGGSTIDVTYTDVEGGTPGEGNIDADPLFVLSGRNDFRLLWDSPCIDVGHPDSLDPDGTRRDMGAYYFNQNDYLTICLTPDETIVAPGGQLGVTYTVMNRWPQLESFWLLTEAVLPLGGTFVLAGPDLYHMPAEATVQVHADHAVPSNAPLGVYVYRSKIGVPPATVYDKDKFKVTVAP